MKADLSLAFLSPNRSAARVGPLIVDGETPNKYMVFICLLTRVPSERIKLLDQNENLWKDVAPRLALVEHICKVQTWVLSTVTERTLHRPSYVFQRDLGDADSDLTPLPNR